MISRAAGARPTAPAARSVSKSVLSRRSAGPRDIIDITMAQLIVRNLEGEVVAELKKRAALNGRSMEAEHREILRAALKPKSAPSLKDLLLRMPAGGEDTAFARPRARPRRVRL